jgi:hypothetical protein
MGASVDAGWAEALLSQHLHAIKHTLWLSKLRFGRRRYGTAGPLINYRADSRSVTSLEEWLVVVERTSHAGHGRKDLVERVVTDHASSHQTTEVRP